MATSSTTTIRVSRRTLQLLDELKKRFDASSYEDVILRLVLEYRKEGCGEILWCRPW